MSDFAQMSALVVCSGVFAFWLWLNHHDGHAVLRLPIEANRRRNPVGYWIIQTLLALLTIATLLAALNLAFGGR